MELLSKSFKYVTFPDYDPEEDCLKLEGWLCLIWNGEDPMYYLRLGAYGKIEEEG